jgi:diaminopimelate decarboxylase
MGKNVKGNRQWWEENGHLQYVGNQLFFVKKNVLKLVEENGTPVFLYNVNKVLSNYKKIKETFSKYAPDEIEPRVYYAMKANGHREILMALKNLNAFIDTTSINEVKLALELGYEPKYIIFTGINFGLDNFEYLAKSGVLINVDSFSQITRLEEFKPLNISIRWNPGIGVGFHKGLIMSGDAIGNLKLGIYKDQIINAFKKAKNFGLNPIGLHQHIGSNWFGDQLPDFLKSVDLTLDLAETLIRDENINLEFVDFGGGLGVKSFELYPEFPLEKYSKAIWERVIKKNLPVKTVAIEPGRFVSGNAGVLLTTVNMVENKGGVDFVGIDAGFNLFNHKFFFGIESEFINLKRNLNKKKLYTIGGSLCESSDIFIENRLMPIINENDILAIFPAGAYGASEMASYHKRDLAKELYY